MRALNRISSKTMTKAGLKALSEGKYADGGGLWLRRRADGGAQWILRVTLHGRRREMGLGSVNIQPSQECAQKPLNGGCWRSQGSILSKPEKKSDARLNETYIS